MTPDHRPISDAAVSHFGVKGRSHSQTDGNWLVGLVAMGVSALRGVAPSTKGESAYWSVVLEPTLSSCGTWWSQDNRLRLLLLLTMLFCKYAGIEYTQLFHSTTDYYVPLQRTASVRKTQAPPRL